MRITESFSLALKNIASSKVRTLLTMLGIIIGVAAVIVIVGLGSGLGWLFWFCTQKHRH